MNKDSKIYIAGSTGLVGANLVQELNRQGYTNINCSIRSYFDLTLQERVNELFEKIKPEYCFLCAAHVGGILENNTKSADIIFNNTMIQTNVIKACHNYGVTKLMFLGSSCIYPNNLTRPIKESDFMTGTMEESNIGYTMAKINGIKMCQLYNKQYGNNFISVMPCNIYGNGDRYDLNRGHVLASLIMKVYEAKKNNDKSITLWGNGQSLREFLHVDDLIDAMIFLMDNYDNPEIINVGSGKDITIIDLAKLIMELMDYKCDILLDETKPNGTYRKILDISKINALGWYAKTSLIDGLKKAIENFISITEKEIHMSSIDKVN